MIPKLVRDGVLAQITATGALPVFRCLDPDNREEILEWLEAKLMEEVLEYLRDGDPLELIDVMEVARALWQHHRKTPEDFIIQSCRKILDVGKFNQLIILENIQYPEKP